MKQLVVVCDDRVGLLAEISEMLATKGINIENCSAEVIGPKAVVRLVVKDETEAKKILETNSFNVVSMEFLSVKLEDKPGQLSKIARLLADNGIQIENIHMMVRERGRGVYALKVDDKEKARELLKDYLV
ncbi:Bifunctional uridylyltransferase/uridylyl-removing enzyme [Candidatus Gugararchaeum adminiculabundum]|nr:Bifunctional uridylyltransferase/uridylyl-removing enzyme [Candidatus Gugararchaeum adminiculabundum]